MEIPVVGLLLAAAMTLVPLQMPAQGPRTGAVDPGLATPAGHEVSFGVSGYTYIEPGALRTSIDGRKLGGEYAGTLSLDTRRRWFATINARASIGSATYDGWCAPSLITPLAASPNGYAVSLGAFSPCTESGHKDRYVEVRALLGKDLGGQKWTPALVTGLGVRLLSNGTRDIPGFRTDTYLYLPVGMTARTRLASQSTLSLNVEYDFLIRGRQTTRNSALGGADVPATATEPAFTIEALDDLSFAQHGGWALRASAKYQLQRRWSVEPYYIHWGIDDSAVSIGTVSFTVNGVTVQQPFGAREPRNLTRELGVKFGFRF